MGRGTLWRNTMSESTFSVQKRLDVASKRTNEQLNSFV